MACEATTVARRGELTEGTTKKFWLQCGDREIEAFVVLHQGEHHAFVNQCRHVPMTMDWVENQFLTEDRCYVQCATHGALFEPSTGLCVEGPPAGKSLIRVPLDWDGDALVAHCPHDLA
jgi:nitrite reductase/ring-hydroxylating ferredoxin subunit